MTCGPTAMATVLSRSTDATRLGERPQRLRRPRRGADVVCMSIRYADIFDRAAIDVATPTLYLDQSAWVRLAQGARGKNVEFEELLAVLASRIEGGELRVVLSATNYLELWHRIDGESRRRVADVMARLSGYVTVAPIEKLIDRDLCRTLGIPEVTRPVFYVGVDHAFASPLGRLRVVAHLADEDGVEGPELSPPEGLVGVLARADPRVREWNHLAGRDRVFDMDGIEVRPEHRLGRQFAALQHELRMRSAGGADPSLLYRSLVSQTFQMISNDLSEDVAAGVRDRLRSAVDGVALVTTHRRSRSSPSCCSGRTGTPITHSGNMIGRT